MNTTTVRFFDKDINIQYEINPCFNDEIIICKYNNLTFYIKTSFDFFGDMIKNIKIINNVTNEKILDENINPGDERNDKENDYILQLMFELLEKYIKQTQDTIFKNINTLKDMNIPFLESLYCINCNKYKTHNILFKFKKERG
jgi:hypothetical protein